MGKTVQYTLLCDELIKTRGVKAPIYRKLGIDRDTFNKYENDTEGKRHIIIDGKFYKRL